MITTILTTLMPILGTIIDKIIPDAEAAAKAKTDMEMAIIEAANKGALAQLEVNRVEAQHRSIWVAGWRPAIGWTCALAIAWTYVGTPIIETILILLDKPVIELPTIDMDYLLELVFGMLGLAGLRSWEKSRGLTK